MNDENNIYCIPRGASISISCEKPRPIMHKCPFENCPSYEQSLENPQMFWTDGDENYHFTCWIQKQVKEAIDKELEKRKENG